MDPSPVAMTPSAVGLVREISRSIDALGFRIPVALTIPATAAGGDRLPSAILLIPGSLMSDVNGDYPAWSSFPHVYGHLARQLTARGHLVFRFAKLGPGSGSVAIDEATASANRNWAARGKIAVAAYQAMQEAMESEGLSAERIVLAGHSEGAVVASQLAAAGRAARIDGVILLAGPSVGILEIMREQAVRFAPAGTEEEAQRDIDRAVDYVRRDEPIPLDLAQRPVVRGLGAMDAVGLRYMRDCDATDPSALAARIAAPVLLVQGGRDTSVPPAHADRLREARGELATECVLFDELQHMFKPLPSGLSPMEAFGLTGETDPRVADAIDSWVRGIDAPNERT